ncbi:hypothetical protein [Sporomusa sphaeroides]|uniref:hypothetical protein n=1 Tax=Sporomusa sphaeroides TaxID=47679 RepID=UPI003158E41C
MADTVHTVNSILRRLLALCLQLLLQRSGHGDAEDGCGSPSYFFCTTIPRVLQENLVNCQTRKFINEISN